MVKEEVILSISQLRRLISEEAISKESKFLIRQKIDNLEDEIDRTIWSV